MTLPLAYPRSVDDLYLARGDEVSSARPVLPGDVFSGLEIGVEHDGHVLIVAHPCSMRGGGGRLRPRLAAAPVPVRLHQDIPFDQWPDGNYNFFPLPGAFPQPEAAALLELGAASREGILGSERVACLSDRGIYLMQQRLVHSLTRVVVGLEQLEAASGHVLGEAELQEEWVERLADLADEGAIVAQVAAFQDFFNDHRADFAARDRRAGVRRLVREEIGVRELGESKPETGPA